MLIFCFVAFVAFGVTLVLVGANQDAMEHVLGLDLAESGLLVAGLSIGLGAGVVAAGPLFDRLPRRPLFAGALLLAGGALYGIDEETGFTGWLVQMTLTGFGIGAYDTFINASVAQRFAAASARPMALMHSGASVGAILGPLWVAWCTSVGHWTDSFQWLGIAHVGLAAVALAIPFPAPRSARRLKAPPRHGITRSLAPLCVVAFAYVGVEACVTLFAVPYAVALGIGAERGLAAISAFWLGLFFGRLLIPAVWKDLGPTTLLLCGAGAAAVICAATSLRFQIAEVSFLSLGLTLGCVYPVTIALASQRAPGAEGTAAGIVAGVGALGGFLIPAPTGALGDATGITTAFGSLVAWCACMALCGALARRLR